MLVKRMLPDLYPDQLSYLTNKRFFKKTRVSYQVLQVYYKIF
jgi:hypothetical protein